MKNLIISSLSVLLISANLAPMAIAQNRTLNIGSFVNAEVPTQGKARIVTRNGKHFLELDSAFTTSDRGPDLHVLLDTEARPPQNYQDFNSYVNLGKLKKFSGSQVYPIPDSIDVSDLKSVVIWCRMANATFGYAPLIRNRFSR